jgi:hypothetical protein
LLGNTGKRKVFQIRLEKKSGICFRFGILLGGVIAYNFYLIKSIIIDRKSKPIGDYGIAGIYGMLLEQLFSWEG